MTLFENLKENLKGNEVGKTLRARRRVLYERASLNQEKARKHQLF